MNRKQTPQEKKRISYLRDRRNCYGENAKASRKAIPFRKRWVNRAYRRNTQQIVSESIHTADTEDIENKINTTRRKNWKKAADIPLIDHIRHQRKWRILRKRRKKTRTLNYQDSLLKDYDR